MRYNLGMDWLYHTIFHGAMLAAAPLFLARAAVAPKFRQELAARLTGWRQLPVRPGCLWVHAASVGEVRIAQTLIRRLQEAHPGRPVVLSTFTPTGYAVAQEAGLCPVFLMPPDSILLLNPLLKRLRPAALALIEAELWPGLLIACRQQGVPVVLLNGRMSGASFQRYDKIRSIFLWLTEGVGFFAMRTEADAGRVKRLGVQACRLDVTGNMKFDAAEEPASPAPEANGPVLVFGSTRPGDEGPVLAAIRQLMADHPQTRYVIAPRHLNRCPEVADLLRGQGLPFAIHSRIDPARPGPGIILVDRLGVLNDYYRRAAAAFVGGGFRPEFGGQNILEPALIGLPVVYGPHMQNFEEEARWLKESGGGLQLDSPEQLYPMLKFLLENPEERAQLGRQAAAAVREKRGAVERNLKILDAIFKAVPDP
ncbi:MAG: 3-deoxy-D-manno-octulosonic acid transferase [Nitrospinaceae bacterium]